MIKEYNIPEQNMDALQKKLARIQRKCAKYGNAFSFEITGEHITDVQTDDGETIPVKYIHVKASGSTRIDNWEYITDVQHTENGNIITTAGTGIEVPERYYNSDLYCEHCGTHRARKQVYIIRNTETGEYKQVGTNCLADYTHGLSAEYVTAYEEFFHDCEEYTSVSGNYIKRYLDVKQYLLHCVETIRIYGYSKRDSESNKKTTRDRVDEFYGYLNGWFNAFYHKDIRERVSAEIKKHNYNEDRPENHAKVDKALEWLKNQDVSGNYMHNLSVVCSLEYTDLRNAGLLCSLFPTYDKNLEKEEMRAKQVAIEKASEYVGEIGKRIEIKPVDARVVTSWETMYGMTFIWKITDESGNIYTWKTANLFKESDGDIILPDTIKGTVKSHNEYRDVKQTEITRCKMMY